MTPVYCSIVLFKNNQKLLKKAIDSVLKSNIVSRLILIDNSPTSELECMSTDSRIEYIHNPLNPGFGAAHNIALKKTLSIGGVYHLVLNPDVYFDSNILYEITQYMNENPSVGNLMPKVYYPDHSIQYLCKLLPTPYDWFARRFNPLKKMIDTRNYTFELRFTGYNQIMEVPYLSGCFMFLRLDSIKKTGFFDENIFMYGEETDLCRRLIANKYKTIFYPNVSITHEFAKGSHKSWKLTWVGVKSAIYYFNKWGWFFDRQRDAINKETLIKLGK